jgi:hypothetical protein
MKKTILFSTLTALLAMYGCTDSGKSDKYGGSEDNSGNVYNTSSNGDTNSHLPGNAVKVNYTSNPQPNPDTSSSYHDTKKKAIEKNN